MDNLDEKSYTKGYIDGLHAAALCCEYSNGLNSTRVSRMTERIRKVAQNVLLKLEVDTNQKTKL